MTKNIFWEDPYLAEFETCVTGVDDDDVAVEKTIFHALSGGRESDHGTIGGSHLKKTGEVGKITLKRRNIGKGKERIETFVGDNREPIVE